LKRAEEAKHKCKVKEDRAPVIKKGKKSKKSGVTETDSSGALETKEAEKERNSMEGEVKKAILVKKSSQKMLGKINRKKRASFDGDSLDSNPSLEGRTSSVRAWKYTYTLTTMRT